MDLTSTTVALLPCSRYEKSALCAAFGSMWQACGSPVNLQGSQVLLKPNLISARLGGLACTEAQFMLAAARWFLDQGSRVSIGDSPAFGTTSSVLDKIGVRKELQNLGVRIADFKDVRRIVLSSGITAGFAADALDCDLLVNLPRVKAHAQMRVTLSVKNYFGCVTGMQKPLWHMIHGGCPGRFESHLLELLAELPKSITFVDGITAMHVTGPINGKPFPLHLTACSTNPVALDTALLVALGIEPRESPLYAASVRAGLPGIELEELKFPLRLPTDLVVKGFKVPSELSPVRFNPFRFGKNSLKRILLRAGVIR